MNDKKETKARVGRGPKISTIWVVPIVGFLIGVWMVWFNWASQGPLIEITFETGEGIEAGKTKVRMLNVDVGEVQSMRLADDAEGVVLSVRMDNQAADLLHEDTSFWVVRPRIGAAGISGLSTILSGAFIELAPGSSLITSESFTGLETPPITEIGTPGLHVTLDSAGNRPLSEGDPILFHGMEVGRIEYVHFNTQERRTYYDAFIAAPYDRLITSNTRFWMSSGFSVTLSADGLRVDVGSLASVVAGGVAFGVPDGQPAGERITERAFFSIYEHEDDIHESNYGQTLSFVVLFDDSIRGLRPGAPVEYRGVRIGQVLRTDIDYIEIQNLLEPDSQIPVLIEIEPARLGFADDESILVDVIEDLDMLIADGLHASLATGSLLTGAKYIELSHEAEPGEAPELFAGFKVIPSIDNELGRLMANAASTLRTINELPLEEAVISAREALDQVTGTVSELENLLTDPETQAIARSLNEALVGFRQLAIDYSQGSATYEDLEQSLESFQDVMDELEPVIRNVRRRPNSLVFGGSEGADPEPQGDRQ